MTGEAKAPDGTGSSRPALVVHVGHGKTGTSSIQWTLEGGRAELEAQGVRPLGYMLEHCRATHLLPKVPLGHDLFGGRDPETFAGALHEVLAEEIRDAEIKGVRRLIWSNDSILPRFDLVAPALSKLRDAGTCVEIPYYVRRHDAWVQSAYFQWGVRHKTYLGPVVPFAEWLGARSIAYKPRIEPWIAAFGDAVRVFNFDAIDDVVRHFLSLNGVTLTTVSIVNERRSPEDLLIWAAFNSLFHEEVLPDRLEPMFEALDRRDGSEATLPDASALFPRQSDLAAIREAYAEDANAINRILESQGQPPLSLSDSIPSRASVDARRLADTLFRLFVIAYREASGVVPGPERLVPSTEPRAAEEAARRVDALSREIEAARREAEEAERRAGVLAERLAAAEAEVAAARSHPFRNAASWGRGRLASMLGWGRD